MEFKDTPALEKVWMLEAQWTNCPKEVKDEIRELWHHYELGNDHYTWQTSILELTEALEDREEDCCCSVPGCPLLIAYLKAHNIPEDDYVYLHYWW